MKFPRARNRKKFAKLDPLAERPNIDFSKGVRGKYSNLFEKGTNVVILDPALLPFFPDSESVNRALHAFLAIGDTVQTAKPTRRRPKNAKVFDPRIGLTAKTASAR